MNAPAVPARLAARPTVAGLVVPWVSLSTRDGRHILGSLHRSRVRTAIENRLCQIDGQPLTRPLVALVTDEELERGWSPEPAMHPECARYSMLACPMVAGQMSHYRAAPPDTTGLSCNDPDCDCVGWVCHDDEPRTARAARPWSALWLHGYEPAIDAAGEVVGLSWYRHTPTRIRPVPRKENTDGC